MSLFRDYSHPDNFVSISSLGDYSQLVRDITQVLRFPASSVRELCANALGYPKAASLEYVLRSRGNQMAFLPVPDFEASLVDAATKRQHGGIYLKDEIGADRLSGARYLYSSTPHEYPYQCDIDELIRRIQTRASDLDDSVYPSVALNYESAWHRCVDLRRFDDAKKLLKAEETAPTFQRNLSTAIRKVKTLMLVPSESLEEGLRALLKSLLRMRKALCHDLLVELVRLEQWQTVIDVLLEDNKRYPLLYKALMLLPFDNPGHALKVFSYLNSRGFPLKDVACNFKEGSEDYKLCGDLFWVLADNYEFLSVNHGEQPVLMLMQFLMVDASFGEGGTRALGGVARDIPDVLFSLPKPSDADRALETERFLNAFETHDFAILVENTWERLRFNEVFGNPIIPSALRSQLSVLRVETALDVYVSRFEIGECVVKEVINPSQKNERVAAMALLVALGDLGLYRAIDRMIQDEYMTKELPTWQRRQLIKVNWLCNARSNIVEERYGPPYLPRFKHFHPTR
ncbi:hypothetical protein [Vibrio mediterranei]|uniref:hypothetical protein n=1 Tax=Vibrio mediterranei TaxID=689 RepID=UPI0040676111